MNDKFNAQKDTLISIKKEISLLHQQVDYLIRNEQPLQLLDLDVMMNRTHILYDLMCQVDLGLGCEDPFLNLTANEENEEPQEEPAMEEKPSMEEEKPLIEEEEKPMEEEKPLEEGKPNLEVSFNLMAGEIEEPSVEEEQPVVEEKPVLEEEKPMVEEKPAEEEEQPKWDVSFNLMADEIEEPSFDEEEPVEEEPSFDEKQPVEEEQLVEEEALPEENEDAYFEEEVEEEPMAEPVIEPNNETIDEPKDDLGFILNFEPAEPEPANKPVYTTGDEIDFEFDVPETLGDKLQRSSINDLHNAIGINDKFLLVNELFGGSMEKYNKSINNLNDLKTLNGALVYMNELRIDLQWNTSNEAYKKLLELVHRKFD
ncbi:MAG: hypothetical protein J6P73_07980 [Bacteroidales bacterium]|nr:hypothetical protein [Bacteroidales bacterium]